MSSVASVNKPPAATRWRLRGRFPEGELAEAPYPALIRHLLWHRGIRTVGQASAFMADTPVAYDPLVLPDAEAVITPKRLDNRYPDTELASGALAFKLMSALYDRMGRPFHENRYLDLVALSTICDVAPLQDENRWLVKQGLVALARTSRLGLAALM